MSPRLPPTAQLARWAVKYGPLLLPYARRLYEQGRFRQLAVMHARTITGGTFSWEMHHGERVWVVWAGDEVVETYPQLTDVDDTTDPFPEARPERRMAPEELPTRRLRDRVSGMSLPTPSMPSLPWRDDPPDDGGAGRRGDPPADDGAGDGPAYGAG